MAEKIDDGGPAFPVPSSIPGGFPASFGLSLREWFAGVAMLANKFDPGSKHAAPLREMPFDVQARSAYAFADAMLKAREAENGNH